MISTGDFFIRKERELGIRLNRVQRQAVLYTEGPLLLLASPGSGKTTTIVMRIGYLVEEKGVEPSRIKALTFSRAAATDMKQRFQQFFPGPAAGGVDFSTIHSLAFQVVQEHFRRAGIKYRVIEGDAGGQVASGPHPGPPHKRQILRELYRRIVGENLTEDQLEELTTYITFVKNKLVPVERLAHVHCDVPEAQRIFREYEAFKRAEAGGLLIDYDDMLVMANRILEKDEELLKKYQARYDYILIDESQDTSLVQHAIIEKLARDHENLCVVADDDQSIYGWRAAEPKYLLDFKKVYPRALILKMEQNYRSSKNIVHVANQFIKRNKNRYDKNMFTFNPPHRDIVIQDLVDYRQQAKYVVEQISQLENPREAAVLYRNRSSSIPLVNELDRRGIPFCIKDADNGFFSHWVVQDILNFMRMAYTDKRPDLLEKIYPKLNGYITKQQMATLKEIHNHESVFDNLVRIVGVKDYQIGPLQTCKKLFAEMKGLTPVEAIAVIRRDLGYEHTLMNMSERLGFRKEHLIGIVNTLEEIADGLGSLEEFANRLQHLENTMKASSRRMDAHAVTLSTLHSAKGLEFDRVYIIDLIEGVLPSNDDIQRLRNKDSAAMEEAARLFYVGMTRAKTHLELVTYRNKDGGKVKESRFVTHVRRIQAPPKSVAKNHRAAPSPHGVEQPDRSTIPVSPRAIRTANGLTAGKSVRHPVFGRGRIVKVEGEIVEIVFNGRPKKLSLPLCLEKGLLEPV
ncbi:ATP-dependent helicase [Kyrpidia spormannii]|uniref:DNA 3'-5' helicase n=1 Tax=Kyrpidia spormannii TaxID=2055160 RepID=A0A6F9E2F2_9BACL|nr:ATP-dependent helicase [Kyrpidia spormannii]CAB3390657.1 DNA helicase [Kyrpidia spormannii]